MRSASLEANTGESEGAIAEIIFVDRGCMMLGSEAGGSNGFTLGTIGLGSLFSPICAMASV